MNYEEDFHVICANNTLNKDLACKIISYYKENNIDAFLNGKIIIVNKPHQFTLRQKWGDHYVYKNKYYLGAHIFPCVESVKHQNNAYYSSDGYWKMAGNNFKDVIVQPKELESWVSDDGCTQ